MSVVTINKRGVKETISFKIIDLQSYKDEGLICFYNLLLYIDDKKYSIPYPILETKESMTQEDLILFVKTLWLVEYIYILTLEYNEVSKNQSAEYREEMQDVMIV